MNNTILTLEEFCEKFNKDIINYLELNFDKLKDSWHENFKLPTESSFFADELIEYTKKSIVGGKRFRPYLIYLMCKDYDLALNYAIGIELLHTFALVHDDIMDKSEIRRGQKSIFKFAAEMANDNLHFGQSMAILIGDYLFSICEGAFEEGLCVENIENHIAARKIFQKLKSEVILGQMLDLELDLSESPSRDEILQKTYLKTASYSVSRPMQIGLAIAGELSPQNMDFCDSFGFNLGLAFQIQDDYLNLAYPESVTGKVQYSDLYENKKTLATWYLLEKNVKANFALMSKQEIKNLLEPEVLPYLKNEIDSNYQAATKIAEESYPLLLGLVEFLSNRTK